MKFWKKIKQNPILRAKLETRSIILNEIRSFFLQKKFIEVDTPLLVKTPGLEPHLNPLEVKFLTDKQTLTEAYLITSPEYALKKLLASGFERIFQINKCWRGGEPYGGAHNPEFTMIEWYKTNADYQSLMTDCENLFQTLYNKICKTSSEKPLMYQNTPINLSSPWKRMSVKEAWKQYARLDLDNLLTKDKMKEAVMSKCLIAAADDEFDDLFFKIFLTFIEPYFPKNIPLFLYDYPAQLAALSRACAYDARYAERVELYIGGLEIGNGYSELIDPLEQKKRFEEDQTRRRQLGKKAYTIDTDFLDALKEGIPPSAGISVGVDRLVMLLTDTSSIDDVIYFPASDLFI